MAKKPLSYVRAHRRKWGLSQVELARLLGLTSRSAISRIERAERTPTTATIIACGIIFGLTTPDLFPSMYRKVEHAITEAVLELDRELAERMDETSMWKRKFLAEVLERINSSQQSHDL